MGINIKSEKARPAIQFVEESSKGGIAKESRTGGPAGGGGDRAKATFKEGKHQLRLKDGGGVNSDKGRRIGLGGRRGKGVEKKWLGLYKQGRPLASIS